MVNRFETYLLPTMHILLPNYNYKKTLGQFENLVFVIMSTRENIRIIARTSSHFTFPVAMLWAYIVT